MGSRHDRFRTVKAQTVEQLALGMNELADQGYYRVIRVMHSDHCPEGHFFAVMERVGGRVSTRSAYWAALKG